MRKWYGAPDLMSKDGNELEEEETPGSAYTEVMYCVFACVDLVGNNIYTCLMLKIEEEEVRDAVLVTDGDNEIGQVIQYTRFNLLVTSICLRNLIVGFLNLRFIHALASTDDHTVPNCQKNSSKSSG